MEAIRIQKIDGQEFVPLTDYLRLKEENKAVWILNDEIIRINEKLREEIKKLNIIIENTKIEQKSDIEHIEGLEEENKKLKEERDELKKEFQQYKEHYNIEKDKQQIFLMTWLRY